jgi:hypothetical protein
MKGSPSVQKASSFKPKEQARATSFNSRAGGANGSPGKGGRYDTTSATFTHGYNEAGALGMVKRLHK